MSNSNRTLIFLSLVMLINALSYGIIIPLLYPYAARFGIGPTGLSWLFASFSIAQFIATPIIGRLSDRFGRKPMLLICLFGTAVSEVLLALSWSAWVLFLARILDGLTGGNNSVAQAVITDTTKPEERAKYFGMLGAAFGVGFLLGPAIGGLLSSISLTAPYWVSASLALFGSIFGYLFLPETVDKTQLQPQPKVSNTSYNIISVLTSPTVGVLFAITLLTAIASNMWIMAFQTFTVDTLKLSSRSVGLLFSLFGLMTIIMQGFGVKKIIRFFNEDSKTLSFSLLGSAITFAGLFIVNHLGQFILAMIVLSVVGASIMPVLSAMITQFSKKEDYGGILGLSQSYNSLGQIIGPLLAGLIISKSSHLTFIFVGLGFLISWLFSLQIKKNVPVKVDL